MADSSNDFQKMLAGLIRELVKTALEPMTRETIKALDDIGKMSIGRDEEILRKVVELEKEVAKLKSENEEIRKRLTSVEAMNRLQLPAKGKPH